MNEERIALANLWAPWRWPARLVLGAFVMSQFVFAYTALLETRVIIPVVIAFVCFAAASMLLTVRWGTTLPKWVVSTVVALALGMVLAEGTHGFVSSSRADDWYLGAAVVVLMALMLWERVAVSWAAFGLIAMLQIWLSSTVGVGLEVTAPVLLRHAGTLVATWFVAYSLCRLAKQLNETANRRTDRESRRAVQLAVARERQAQFARLETLAGSLLRRITEGRSLSQAERFECQLVEASLRDSMSGRNWATPEVLAAARRARERGVRVILLDDGSGTVPQTSWAAKQLAPMLDAMHSGECTARLLPAGRAAVASVMIAEADAVPRFVELVPPTE
ncbi:MAG: hypothetical protein ACKOXM_02135 [Agromyces sp.]